MEKPTVSIQFHTSLSGSPSSRGWGGYREVALQEVGGWLTRSVSIKQIPLISSATEVRSGS